MKVIKKIADIDKIRQSMEEILLRQTSNSLVFIDTNFLTWIYRINKPSFKELTKFIYSLIQHEKLVIPNWVIHEYNNLISKNSEEIFSPIKKKLRLVERELELLKQTSRMTVDDEFAVKKGYTDKKAFLLELDNEIKSLNKKIGYLRDNNDYKDESRGKFIEEIIESAPSKANMNDILKSLEFFPLRFHLRIPPGYQDADKPENKYGDMIIWAEILANSRGKNLTEVLFLSRDVKDDWVYSPTEIVLNGKLIGNNQSVKYNIAQPWLEHEMIENSPGTSFLIADMQMLIDVLYSPEHNFNNFGGFKNLAKTINLELKNSETHKVIEWLVNREDQMSMLIKTVCYWSVSPGEVDIANLENWCVENIDVKVDFSKVNWN